MIKFAKRDPDPSRKIIKQDSSGPLGLKKNSTLVVSDFPSSEFAVTDTNRITLV